MWNNMSCKNIGAANITTKMFDDIRHTTKIKNNLFSLGVFSSQVDNFRS